METTRTSDDTTETAPAKETEIEAIDGLARSALTSANRAALALADCFAQVQHSLILERDIEPIWRAVIDVREALQVLRAHSRPLVKKAKREAGVQ